MEAHLFHFCFNFDTVAESPIGPALQFSECPICAMVHEGRQPRSASRVNRPGCPLLPKDLGGARCPTKAIFIWDGSTSRKALHDSGATQIGRRTSQPSVSLEMPEGTAVVPRCVFTLTVGRHAD
eukprot:6466623-Amphidinium_carterae.1